jgi:hypothetical protein
MMLHQVFDCASYSKYYRPENASKHTHLVTYENCARPLPDTWERACDVMSGDTDAVHLVKTHEPPHDSQPAIYIVRNGLAVVRSYKHYLFDVDKVDYSLEQVILGEPIFGSWGAHLDAWDPLHRPNTLFLKYEDLIHSPERELDRVESFLRLRKLRKWVNNFEQLQAANPKMFRQGAAVAPAHGFTQHQLQLFSALHGDWMARLDYSAPAFTTPRELRTLLPQQLKSNAAPRARASRTRPLRVRISRRLSHLYNSAAAAASNIISNSAIARLFKRAFSCGAMAVGVDIV